MAYHNSISLFVASLRISLVYLHKTVVVSVTNGGDLFAKKLIGLPPIPGTGFSPAAQKSLLGVFSLVIQAIIVTCYAKMLPTVSP